MKSRVLLLGGGCQKSLFEGWLVPVSVHRVLSALGAESQIVVTCEKFNREFWRVFWGILRFKV